VTLITLYLGIYNGEKYLDSLFHQIQSQDYQNFKILVVDNNSSNINEKIFKNWNLAYGENFEFVKNKKNFGGHGSLFKNLHKIRTPWFCTLHQDDYYKPNHISTISNLISENQKNVVGVFTTMGSMSSSGKIMNSKPRVSWFSPNLDQPGQFLQNIRAQTVPFPAAAFKLDIFQQTKVPIHSASFSDTEQTLRMLGYGRFIYSKKQTMLYRENPNSESHVLNESERIIGATVALSRVFCSKEFSAVLDKVEKPKRAMFAVQLINSLAHRVPKSELLTTLENIALEQMIAKWGYSEKEISQTLGKNYANLFSTQTVEVLNNLSNIVVRKKNTKKVFTQKSTISKLWDFYFNLTLFRSIKLDKLLTKSIYKLIFIFKPNHRLRNKWK
jgi:glycosyltransferase involved in cell wall biosynthesis